MYRIVAEKPERNRPLGRPGLDKRIILKWDFGMWIEGMDCVDLVQDR